MTENSNGGIVADRDCRLAARVVTSDPLQRAGPARQASVPIPLGSGPGAACPHALLDFAHQARRGEPLQDPFCGVQRDIEPGLQGIDSQRHARVLDDPVDDPLHDSGSIAASMVVIWRAQGLRHRRAEGASARRGVRHVGDM